MSPGPSAGSSAPHGAAPNLQGVNAWSADYLEAMYAQFKADPSAIPADLRAFFQGFDLARAVAPSEGGGPADADATRLQIGVGALVSQYRLVGNLAATLDPFGRARPRPAGLELAHHGLTPADLDKVVETNVGPSPSHATLREVIDRLERTYCRSIGAEYMHILDTQERDWLRDELERAGGRFTPERPMRIHLLRQLLEAESFETFLGKRYPGDKRFSLEGAESLIPLLNHLLERGTDLGVEEVVLGMAHRGRLNVLNNVMGKSYEQIFTEFEDNWSEGFVDGGGDVKYHRGYSGERSFPNGRAVRLTMTSNPSHLEAVNPVVQGRCRGKQRLRGDKERRRVIPVLIHGDAAMAGQGIVSEVFNLSQLEGYTTGGTVHVVVNNLIGFTTAPEDARSSRYCTDSAKAIDAPVLHVNGEDPEAVLFAADLAIRYRTMFRKDVVIDMLCFRRYGHNEQDEASFTQPLLTTLVSRKQGVRRVYAEKLLAEGVITEDDMTRMRQRLDEALDAAQRAAKQTPYDPTIDPGSDRWAGLSRSYQHESVDTGAPMPVLEEVCAALGRTPEGFNLNPKLKSLLNSRVELPRTGQVSYADAESLAYGTLLLEGVPIRLSGQDCRRGTFSHRHAVLRDMQTEEPWTPLNSMREVGEPGTDKAPGSPGSDGRPRQARFCVYDSPLSEASVLGFDYGYSLVDPNMLVLWEAQFGDFVNGAQAIIDQFLASAEVKWERWSGLVLLLPHGYEGAGPEHSSCRVERFLQLCAGGNMQVAYPSTGAQIFHLLRRQVKRAFRKPLIVLTPKSMLRTPTSHISELTSGSFREVMDDPRFVGGASRRDVKRVLLCSGKVYFDLAERRDELRREDVAIVRVEQMYPVHGDLLRQVLSAYPPGVEIVYVQEEPRNAGAYLFMADAMAQLGLPTPAYIGRDASASPAVGSKSRHKLEQEAILEKAVGPKPSKGKSAATDESSRKAKPVSTRG